MHRILMALFPLCALTLPQGLLWAEPVKLSWSERMQGLSSVLRELLTDTASPERFESPANRDRIQTNLKALADLAHEVTTEIQASRAPEGDPSLAFFSDFLSENSDRAAWAFRNGSTSYARGLVRGTVSSCMACHTRHEGGPRFEYGMEDLSWKGLSPLEKAELLTALRRFNPALREYERLIGDDDFASSSPREWETAVRQGVNLAVRVKDDPEMAGKLVRLAVKNNKAPAFARGTMMLWEEDIARWRKEGPRPSDPLSRAERLIEEGNRNRRYPADHAADVTYLRATSVLHKYLQNRPGNRETARALMLTGTAYEALDGMGLWYLPELYYRACIEVSPGTDLSRGCYQSYEAAVHAAFTGSSGLRLPPEMKADLKSLRRKAYTKAP